MPQKLNNDRKYPNANHQPCHKAYDRKLRSEARQSVYDELTLEQKIAALPPEPHAKKVRARLLTLSEKQKQLKVEVPKPQVSETVKQTPKHMKGSKQP